MKMMSIEEVIDYEFLDSFELSLLKEALVIPIKSDNIYMNCFTCKNSNISLLKTNLLLKKIEIDKEEILFFLSDFSFRKKLYQQVIMIVKNKENENSIAIFIDSLLNKAIELRVSDIHIESLKKIVLIRFRIDGVLKTFYYFEKKLSFSISSYIKYLSKLDITQNRVPMDGRFTIFLKEKKYDFRVSTMPTIYGESIVIRVLDNKTITKNLSKLGFTKRVHEKMKKLLSLKEGLILIAGPTGSGKTTTLYSIIEELNSENKKIITVEDPVEYKIQGVQQIEVNEQIGLSFSSVLRNILRQDPDIILIGEIRDKKSLSIAFQAALTGHLVLASIHANDSIQTLSRLIDLDTDYYLLVSTLKSIISQRLILNYCKKCNNQGCEICSYTGYFGRSCIAEILDIDEAISSFILSDFKLEEIKKYLKKINFNTIFDDGILKVNSKQSSLEEIYRVMNI